MSVFFKNLILLWKGMRKYANKRVSFNFYIIVSGA